MAGLGHLAVGMTAARLYGTERRAQRPALTALLFWSALSFLPDADVVGFALGVRYGDEWGHRGATHSFAFALAIGAAIGVAGLVVRRPAIRAAVTATLVVASHALLDTLTDGGLGCALFWPFDLTRYFAPWTPIPVSPIGPGILSPYGMYVIAVELLLFVPLLWFALRPPVRPLIPVVLWLAALWLFLSGDPLRERIVRAVLRDDTVFAHGFSDSKLDSIERGDTLEGVRARIGPPLREFLDYDRLDTCSVVRIERDLVADAHVSVAGCTAAARMTATIAHGLSVSRTTASPESSADGCGSNSLRSSPSSSKSARGGRAGSRHRGSPSWSGGGGGGLLIFTTDDPPRWSRTVRRSD